MAYTHTKCIVSLLTTALIITIIVFANCPSDYIISLSNTCQKVSLIILAVECFLILVVVCFIISRRHEETDVPFVNEESLIHGINSNYNDGIL